MSQSDDLTKLFKRFGGDSTSYREITRSESAQQARARWPLLSAVQADRPEEVPPVALGELAGGPLRHASTPQPTPQPTRQPALQLAPQPVSPQPLIQAAAAQPPVPPSPAAQLAPGFASPRPPLPVRTAGLSPAGEPSPMPASATPATPAAPAALAPFTAPQAAHAMQAHAAKPAPAKLTLQQRLADMTVPPPAPMLAPAFVPPPQPAQFTAGAAAASAGAASATAGTELGRVFARLEGRSADPATERAQLRRSLLDRLKRP